MSLVFQDSGAIAQAHMTLLKGSMFAWGGVGGGSSWTVNPPPPGSNNKRLLEEFVRREPTSVQFVRADPVGSIDVNGVKYSPSNDPTNQIYLEFKFNESDNPSDVFYQLGLFVHTKPSIPLPQEGFTVAPALTGDTTLNVSAFDTGISELMPDPDLSSNGGRLVEIDSIRYRVNSINPALNTITLATPLEADFAGGVCSAIEMFAPSGDLFYEEDLLDPGYLMFMNNIPPVYRNPAAKEQFFLVISF